MMYFSPVLKTLNTPHKLSRASAISVLTTAAALLLTTQLLVPMPTAAARASITDPQAITAPSPVSTPADNPGAPINLLPSSFSVATPDASPTPAASLDELVARQPDTALGDQLTCLATAIYFEAGHETYAGRLAVARVIVARTTSGRFPTSYCGVVMQRGQFSFVRHGVLPAVPTTSRAWQGAAAIARIADSASWQSPVEGALFFHSARIAPHWRMQRIAQVDNTVFYH